MLTELHPALEISLVVAVPTLVALWGKHTFVLRQSCELERHKCSKNICKKIEELKAGQLKMFEFVQQTQHTLGRVEQYMEDHNGNKAARP